MRRDSRPRGYCRYWRTLVLLLQKCREFKSTGTFAKPFNLLLSLILVVQEVEVASKSINQAALRIFQDNFRINGTRIYIDVLKYSGFLPFEISDYLQVLVDNRLINRLSCSVRANLSAR